MVAVRGKSMSVNVRNYTIKPMKMLFPLIASVIICLLQQGVGQDINSLSVCVNLEGNSLLVEWQPPFPDNADTLDVHCSSLNHSFSNSFTVRLSSEILNTIAVQVPIHGGGVHLGYIYIIQATLRTTDGIQIRSDPITAVANYFQDIYWLFKSNSSITFHCTLSTTCSRVIGGCMVSLIRQADGQFVNQTIPVVGRKDTVEGSFSNLNFSEPYLFTATAVRRDLMTPLGRAVSGIIPALTFNDISDNSNISQSTIPNVATATSKVPTTSLLPTIVSSSLKSSSLSATSSVSITRSVSSIAGRSTSLTSSVIQSSSSISIIQSTMSTTVKESTLLTGVGQDRTTGRSRSSSNMFPVIAIIGIICGIVLLLVGILSFVLMILARIRPARKSLNVAASTDKHHRSLFWPFNVSSSKRNGELHPSINVDCTLDASQCNLEMNKLNTDASGYMKIAPQVQKQSIAAEYEVPIKSPSVETTKAPVPFPDQLGTTIYEMPTVPNQTAYLTEDFKKRPT